MRDNLPTMLRDAAKKWREKNKVVGVGELRYDFALEEAADAIEELSKKRVGTWHRIKGTKKSYLFICNSCGEMYPYLTACCPFCGVKYKGERAPKEE